MVDEWGPEVLNIALIRGGALPGPAFAMRAPADCQRVADAGSFRGRRSKARLRQWDPSSHRCDAPHRSALGATLIAGTDLRSDMKDFVPSCFHNASTGGSNANAAPEGGV